MDITMLALIGAFIVANVSSFLVGAAWGKDSLRKTISDYRSFDPNKDF